MTELDQWEDLEQHLARFGLSSFRSGQREVIETVLSGRDCLCIMPTGGGKSLCYQLPAVARSGVTLVVSPLIALMKDQVDAMLATGVRATFINSALTSTDQGDRLLRMSSGEYDLVYIAPERLRSPRFLESVRRTNISLLAIDEAHCISEWGHDFRPDYARLGTFRTRLGNPQTIALTATATPDVRTDVVKQLGLRDPAVFITGFARPNLRFEVQAPNGAAEKDDALVAAIQATPGAGIVYASTRKRCEELVPLLRKKLQRTVGFYHAGLPPDERRLTQEAFMRGDPQIIVATNAFGMGIDKSDLRFVIHYNLPGTLEAYYQEAGRAGRDGQPSRCLLLFSYADRYLQEFFIENAYPDPVVVSTVYDFLCHCDVDPVEMTLQELKERLQLPVGIEGVGACERILEKAGAIERLDARENMASVKIDSDLPTLTDLLPRDAKVRRKVLRAVEREVGELRYEWAYFRLPILAAKLEMDRDNLQRTLRELKALPGFDYVPPFRGRAVHVIDPSKPFSKLEIDFAELRRRKTMELEKLERVIRFARTTHCRQMEILEYFGDPHRKRCGACDRCQPGAPSLAKAAASTLPATVSDAMLEAVRIALSAAARAKGRVGKQLLAKLLCGSKDATLSKLHLDQLPTYGMLDELRQVDALALLDGLLQIGLLEQVDLQRHRPIVQLTPSGRQVMRGETPLAAVPPLSDSARRRIEARRVRGTAAPSGGATTNRVATAADTDEPSPPAATSGASSTPASREPPAAAPRDSADTTATFANFEQSQPPCYWTWRLLRDGYSLDECATIRGLDRAAIVDHLRQARQAGVLVEDEWLTD